MIGFELILLLKCLHFSQWKKVSGHVYYFVMMKLNSKGKEFGEEHRVLNQNLANFAGNALKFVSENCK